MIQNQDVYLSEKHINLILFFIVSLYPLVGMGIDLIVPSLPAISYSLKVSSVFSKNLVSVYMFGGVLGNFLISFLADSIGRRKLVLSILFIFFIASVLPLFLQNYPILLLSRLLQGVAMAPFVVLARAIFTDILSNEKLMRVAIIATLMWGIGPIAGPVIGGYLQFYFGYKACFYFFASFSLFGFIALFKILPETNRHYLPLNLTKYKESLTTIFSHSIFIGLILVMGISFSTVIVFNVIGPFLIQSILRHSAVYFGHIALWMGAGFVLGTMICKELIKKYKDETIIIAGLSFCFIISLLAVIFTYINPLSIWIITIPSFLMCLSCGVIYPTAMGKSMSLFRHLAGSASSVMSFVSLVIPASIALIISFINAKTALSLTLTYLTLSFLCGVCYWFFVRTYQRVPTI